ncbi:hypothetical protein TNCV_1685921 [Trichonephila clavipes]|nr:hypothetical protein TNCV_1685921 [Trichonephila clavipes]
MRDLTYGEKMQTCISGKAMQMVMSELRNQCIILNFLIDECRITEFFRGYNVNFVKPFRSTLPDTMLVQVLLRSSSLEESILNVVADRPESTKRSVAHHVNVSLQTIFECYMKIVYTSPNFSECNFESDKLSPMDATAKCAFSWIP